MTLTFLLTDTEARPPSQGDTEDRGPPGDGTRLPSRHESPSTPLGVLQVCPTCSPDRCSRRCGLIRTARPSRSDRERSRVATCSRWCAGRPPPQPSRPPSRPSRATGYRHDRTLAGDRRAHRHARRRYDDWVPTLARGLACAATTSLARRPRPWPPTESPRPSSNGWPSPRPSAGSTRPDSPVGKQAPGQGSNVGRPSGRSTASVSRHRCAVPSRAASWDAGRSQGARRPRPTGRLAAGPQRRVQRWMTTGRE
jgi:hypothetical protein